MSKGKGERGSVGAASDSKKMKAIRHLLVHGPRGSEWQEAGLLHEIDKIVNDETSTEIFVRIPDWRVRTCRKVLTMSGYDDLISGYRTGLPMALVKHFLPKMTEDLMRQAEKWGATEVLHATRGRWRKSDLCDFIAKRVDFVPVVMETLWRGSELGWRLAR